MAKEIVQTQAGWRKLSDSPKAKRHNFDANSKESVCGGAMMSKPIDPEDVADNDAMNCTKCQAVLKERESKGTVDTKAPAKKSAKDPDAAPAKKAAAAPSKEDVKAQKAKEAADAKAKKEKEVADAKAKKEKEAAAAQAKKDKAAKALEDKKAKEEKAAQAKKDKEAKIAEAKKAKEDAKAARKKEIEDKKSKREADRAAKKAERESAIAKKKLERMPTVLVTEFTSTDELLKIAKTLDVAEEMPVVINGKEQEDVRAIWNTTKDRRAAIVGEDYSLVQHREAVKYVAKGLEALNTPVYGKVKNMEDVVTIEVFFPKLHIKDDAKGIDVGGKIVNSYNKSRAFKGFMVAQRKVCTNGMYMKKLIPECEFFEIHVGDLANEIPALLKEFFDHLKETTEAIKSIIDQAMETTIKFKNMEEVEATFTEVLKSPVHMKALIRDGHLDKSWSAENREKMVMTKWEFVNAITSYVSHSPVVESRIDIYSSWAEEILDPEYTLKVVKPEPAKKAEKVTKE